MMWVQAALFPGFDTDFWAYEFQFLDYTWWEIFDGDDQRVSVVESDDFGDFLDFAREINYDVKINTVESWIAMEGMV